MSELEQQLRSSIRRQEMILRSSLVLNPVENFPFESDLAASTSLLHGLYNSDKLRTPEQRREADVQFAGRRPIERDSRKAYAAWAEALGAQDATLRLLSGLHAHIALFMSISKPGQKVLLLPVEAGGHMSGRRILERLGLEIVDAVIDNAAMAVDVEATLSRAEQSQPDFVFIDRSEGLVYEDFSQLAQLDATSIFDASQYLTNIITGDLPNPFESGFDQVVATLHKNFPGPQKALLATAKMDDAWTSVVKGLSTFVSNMHLASTYAATLSLTRTAWLSDYSKQMLAYAPILESELAERGVPVVRRDPDLPPTHHVWIREPSKEAAFETFEALERSRVLTNFRKLPYGLGHGLRLGVSAAVRIGMAESDIPKIADLIATIRSEGSTPANRHEVRALSQELWSRFEP